MTVDEFRRELVGVPLCGTPDSGQFAGKMLCTVHLPDGTAVVAGRGRGLRAVGDERRAVCRRNAEDPLDRRRCVSTSRSAAAISATATASVSASARARPRDSRSAKKELRPFRRSCPSSDLRMILPQNHAGGSYACMARRRGGPADLRCGPRGQQAHAEGDPDRFFDGKAFSAATTSNVKFKMVFTADGKVTREPQAKPASRAKGPGNSRRTVSAPAGRAARRPASRWSMSRRTSGRW